MKEALLESLLRTMRLRRVLPHIGIFNNPRVLDVGCGWEARLLKAIEPYISQGVGIDFKAPQINTDKLHTFSYFFESKDCSESKIQEGLINADSIISTGGGVMMTNSKPCTLPFENESFEVVTLLAVLEHLNYPLECLHEISRVLKPNGICLLTVPSHLAKPVLEFLAYKLKIVSEAEIRDHKRYYNKQDLLDLLDQTPQLSLKKHHYFQCGMNNFALIIKDSQEKCFKN